ncbi:hypothetical protein SD70_23435 [Gordoniibacillus kamchatkensis]|uniref:Uncharacterized protein n=1 Tax=Gordoniibacillus kamchatkensis TaxID=1590651 RepID=A0ABR5ACY4_9BACL|nr:hypothetical protein SD70_23435 [Paenibacillus sp. VKM B-2647]
MAHVTNARVSAEALRFARPDEAAAVRHAVNPGGTTEELTPFVPSDVHSERLGRKGFFGYIGKYMLHLYLADSVNGALSCRSNGEQRAYCLTASLTPVNELVRKDGASRLSLAVMDTCAGRTAATDEGRKFE